MTARFNAVTKTSQLVLGLFCLLLIATNGWTAEQQTLTVGWEAWPPYQYKDEQSTLLGLDVELFKAIAESAGYSIRFEEMPWTRHLQSLKRGTTDMASGISYSEERAEFLHYSAPYRNETVVLLVRKGDAEKFQFSSLADIIGTSFQLGVQQNYYYGEEYEGLKENPDFMAQVQEVYEADANYRKLFKKRIDGILVDPYAAASQVKTLGYGGQIEFHPLEIHSDAIHLVFSRQSVSPDIVEVFNEAIQRENANGNIKKIINSWLDAE